MPTPSSGSFDANAGQLVLGRYRIIRPMGRGGTGVVYLGRTEGAAGFSKPVVVKRLLPNFVRDPVHAQMLVREARILANLKHPGIVGVVDLGEDDDAYVMVLEYVHGYDLGLWLKYLRAKQRRLPVEIALEIAIRVLEALHYAHTLKKPDGSPGGVIHRDISPSNILLDLDGSVRILDFGIAQVTDELADQDTKRNLFKGKVGYSHPKLLQMGMPSAATDTYSAGVVALQMLLGYNPFYAESTAATIERVMRMPLPKVTEFRPDAPAELERILARALSRDIEHAYATAAELATELKAVFVRDAQLGERLREMVQADFNGEMPAHLKLEALDERDAAWRSFDASHDAGLRRASRAPESGEPTVLARPLRADDSPARTRASSEDGTIVAPLTSKSRTAPTVGYWAWAAVSVLIALMTVAVVLLMKGNAAKPEPRYLVVSGSGVANASSSASSTTPAPSVVPDSIVPTASMASTRAEPVKSSLSGPQTPREPTSQYLTQIFARRQAQIQACFVRAKPEPANQTLQVMFQVDASGKVTAATVSPLDVAGTPLGRCLLGVARGTRFGALTQAASFRIPVRASVR